MHQTIPPLRLANQHGTVRHIGEVSSGLACDCTCVACGERVIAKKGQQVQHHFAHESGAECAGAFETALHLAAKQAIQRRRSIYLPSILLEFRTRKKSYVIAEAQVVAFDSVVLESRQSELSIDVLGSCAGKPLAIEIRVTHAVDSKKLARLRELNLSTVEVDLSTVSRDVTIQEIESLVVEKPQNRKWLFHCSVEPTRIDLFRLGTRLPTVRRRNSHHVDWCPLEHWHYKGKPYANLGMHCAYCENALDILPNSSAVICNAAPMKSEVQHELFPAGDA